MMILPPHRSPWQAILLIPLAIGLVLWALRVVAVALFGRDRS